MVDQAKENKNAKILSAKTAAEERIRERLPAGCATLSLPEIIETFHPLLKDWVTFRDNSRRGDWTANLMGGLRENSAMLDDTQHENNWKALLATWNTLPNTKRILPQPSAPQSQQLILNTEHLMSAMPSEVQS